METFERSNYTFENLQKIVQNDFKDFNPLIKISKKINVAPANLILGLLILFFVMIINGILGDKIVYILGFIYPFYKSSVCLKNKNKKQMKFWLIYWVIFSGMIEFHKIFRILLFFLPKSVYNIMIAIFFLLLYHPRSQMIPNFYEKIMKPHYKTLRIIEEKTQKFWKDLLK